jgi:AraC-like DNA-binding protein
MGRTVRLFEGRFGRLLLTDLAPQDEIRAQADPAIILEQGAEEILLLNPGELHVSLGASRALELHAAGDWLRASFPAAFELEEARPFPQLRELVTPRIRQLADTLAIEVLNDQFLSHERLEFMLQELMLSIVETYVARRQAGGRLWRGSPFADTRIRRAIALLRAHPNKDVNMNDLASQVGLSRSRFYDLFQLSTGRSPRSYLDMLCVESAISKLSSGSGKIAEVSAELGFSAQSNFTRFFQQQVGIPPSEYRRAAIKPNTDPQDETGG